MTNELIYDVLKRMQADLADLKATVRIIGEDMRGMKSILGAILTHQSAPTRPSPA